MRGRRSTFVRRGRTCPPSSASPCRRNLRFQPHALSTSAGVCGHGAAGRAGGTASSARAQASPFRIGMGETTKVAGDGGPPARNGGAGDACAIGRRRRTPRPAAKHTAPRRRVRTRRASTVTSPLSASRADEKQFSTSTEQMRERRARMGGCGNAAWAPWSERRWCRWRGRRRRRWQERRTFAESDALVGSHGRAAAAHLPADQRTAALRDGATPRAALSATRRVTSPRLCTFLSYHAYIPLSGRSDSPECTRVPEYYRLDNLFIWEPRPLRRHRRLHRRQGAPERVACFVICATGSCCDSADRSE